MLIEPLAAITNFVASARAVYLQQVHGVQQGQRGQQVQQVPETQGEVQFNKRAKQLSVYLYLFLKQNHKKSGFHHLRNLHGHQTFQRVQRVQGHQGVQGLRRLQQGRSLHGLPEKQEPKMSISENQCTAAIGHIFLPKSLLPGCLLNSPWLQRVHRVQQLPRYQGLPEVTTSEQVGEHLLGSH